MKITNLDAFNKDDQIIILDGREWKIPGEIPVDYVFSILECQQKHEQDPENPEHLDKQYAILIEIFQKRQPDLTLKEFKRMITARQTGILITQLMRSLGSEIEDEKKTEELSEEQINMQ